MKTIDSIIIWLIFSGVIFMTLKEALCSMNLLSLGIITCILLIYYAYTSHLILRLLKYMYLYREALIYLIISIAITGLGVAGCIYIICVVITTLFHTIGTLIKLIIGCAII